MLRSFAAIAFATVASGALAQDYSKPIPGMAYATKAGPCNVGPVCTVRCDSPMHVLIAAVCNNHKDTSQPTYKGQSEATCPGGAGDSMQGICIVPR
jgi:hypothetical protein